MDVMMTGSFVATSFECFKNVTSPFRPSPMKHGGPILTFSDLPRLDTGRNLGYVAPRGPGSLPRPEASPRL